MRRGVVGAVSEDGALVRLCLVELRELQLEAGKIELGIATVRCSIDGLLECSLSLDKVACTLQGCAEAVEGAGVVWMDGENAAIIRCCSGVFGKCGLGRGQSIGAGVGA